MKIDFEAVQDLIADVGETCLLPHFRNLGPGDIALKGGDDPVTIADQKAEKALTEALKKILPGSNVLGEEAFFADPSIIAAFDSDAPLWIVDPLDGTRQFVGGDPNFGIIVALVQKGQTVAGWLYNPIQKEMVMGEKGAGAYCHGRRLQALPGGPLPSLSGRLGTTFINAYPHLDDLDSDLQAPVFKRFGSACDGYACLAKGPDQFRANHELTTPWDDAAGVLIYQEAGGMAAHWDGTPYDPRSYHVGLLAAADQKTWQAVRDWIAGYCPLPAR